MRFIYILIKCTIFQLNQRNSLFIHGTYSTAIYRTLQLKILRKGLNHGKTALLTNILSVLQIKLRMNKLLSLSLCVSILLLESTNRRQDSSSWLTPESGFIIPSSKYLAATNPQLDHFTFFFILIPQPHCVRTV